MNTIILILALTTTLIPFFVGRRYGILQWVSPLQIVAYYVLFGVFVKTVATAFYPDVAFFRPHISQEISILSGHLFLLIFIIMVCIGYVVGVRKRPAPNLHQYAVIGLQKIRHPGKLAIASVLIFLATATAILSARGISGLSSLFSIETLYAVNTQKVVRIEGVEGFGQNFAALKSLFIIPTFAFVVWIGRQIQHPSGVRFTMSLTLAMMVVFMIIFQAKRLELLNLVIYYLCIYVLLGNKVDHKLLAKLVIAFGLIISVFVIMTTLRATKGGLDNADFVLLEPILQIAGSTYFIDINMPIIIIDRLDQFEPFWGESYFYWLFGWIPRGLWPDKPAVTLGPFVKQEIFGIYRSVGGINPTGAGEAILNFRWAGVLVGLILGFAYRRIEEHILKPTFLAYRGGLWIYPLVFYPFILGTLQSSFSAVIIGAITTTVLLKIMVTVFSLKPRKPSQRSSTIYPVTTKI